MEHLRSLSVLKAICGTDWMWLDVYYYESTASEGFLWHKTFSKWWTQKHDLSVMASNGITIIGRPDIGIKLSTWQSKWQHRRRFQLTQKGWCGPCWNSSPHHTIPAHIIDMDINGNGIYDDLTCTAPGPMPSCPTELKDWKRFCPTRVPSDIVRTLSCSKVHWSAHLIK